VLDKQMRFCIETKPLPAPRPRFSKYGTYNKKEYTQYKQKIAWMYKSKGGSLYDGIVNIKIDFFFMVPKSWSKKKKECMDEYLPKADVDNLAKAVLDALNGIAYEDDRQIQSLFVRKQYSKSNAVVIEILER